MHLIPETPDTSEPLVDARVLWSSMPAADAIETVSADGIEEPVTPWLPEPLPVPVDEADAEGPVPFADTSIFAQLDASPEEHTSVAPVDEPLPAAAIEHVPAEWWKEALPWREEPQASATYDEPAGAIEPTSALIAADALVAEDEPSSARVGEDFGYLSLDTIDAQAEAVALSEDGERQIDIEPVPSTDALVSGEAVDVADLPVVETAAVPLPTVGEETAALVETDAEEDTVDAAATVSEGELALDEVTLIDDVISGVDDHDVPVAASMEAPAPAVAFIAPEEPTAATELVAETAADALNEPYVYEESSIGGAEAMAPAGASRPFGDIEPILLQADDEDMSAESSFGFQPVDDAPIAAAASLFGHDAGGDGSHDWRTAFLGAPVEAAPAMDDFFGQASSLPSNVESTDELIGEVELAADVVLESDAVAGAEWLLAPVVEDVHAAESTRVEEVAFVEAASPAGEATVVEEVEHVESIPYAEEPIVGIEAAPATEIDLVSAPDALTAIEFDELLASDGGDDDLVADTAAAVAVAAAATAVDGDVDGRAGSPSQALSTDNELTLVAEAVPGLDSAQDDTSDLGEETVPVDEASFHVEAEAVSEAAAEIVAEEPPVFVADEFESDAAVDAIAEAVPVDESSLHDELELALEPFADAVTSDAPSPEPECEQPVQAIAELDVEDAPVLASHEETVVLETADAIAEFVPVDELALHDELESTYEPVAEVVADDGTMLDAESDEPQEATAALAGDDALAFEAFDSIAVDETEPLADSAPVDELVLDDEAAHESNRGSHLRRRRVCRR